MVFLLVLMFVASVAAQEKKEYKQTVVYGTCGTNCGLYGQTVRVYTDSIGRYAVCEQNTMGLWGWEVGYRLYIPDTAIVRIWGEPVGLCSGSDRWYVDRIYIDLIYLDSLDFDCMPSEALAEALLEAKRVDCESNAGSEFFGDVKQRGNYWCISGRCDACNSEWRESKVNTAKQACCDRGSEPEPDRGVCLNAKENPVKGISGSTLYLLPQCTDKTPDYESGSSFCEPPPSSCSSSDNVSSSSGAQSSSSAEPPPSSSSSFVGCFSMLDAVAAEKRRLELQCLAEKGSPDYGIDEDNCLWGQCSSRPSSSSSELSFSSSVGASSSSSEASQCPVSMRSLQKPVNYYDDWVYIGKETYGSKVVTSSSLKPGTKFFDVLGKVYDKMKAKIQYYVRKDAIKREERDVLMEFDVWGRIIKDEDGNDIQMFIKEDKRNGLRKDSSFYYDGYWDVLETDNVARTIKSQTSFGVKIVSLHDDKWRVTSNVMTNKYNDTVAHDLYFWKNGRLAKTIFNGVERNFIYGKTLQDTVKVVPSDRGLYFHSGYNNSVGVIPDENELEYASFVKNPYTAYLVPKEVPVLRRHYKLGLDVIDNNYPEPIYEFTLLENAIDKNFIYPKGKSGGEARFDADIINSKCLGKNGCYYLEYEAKMLEKKIILFQSHLKYESGRWQRYCRTSDQLKLTYAHEKIHIQNADIALMKYSGIAMPSRMKSFSSRNECEDALRIGREMFKSKWNHWKIREANHCNGVGNLRGYDCLAGQYDQRSPAQGNFEYGELCDADMRD